MAGGGRVAGGPGLVEGPGSLALMLNAEISAVITAMRSNAKWAVVPSKYNVSKKSNRGPALPFFFRAITAAGPELCSSPPSFGWMRGLVKSSSSGVGG